MTSPLLPTVATGRPFPRRLSGRFVISRSRPVTAGPLLATLMLLAAGGASTAAHAQTDAPAADGSPPSSTSSQWALGLGVNTQQRAYTGADNKNTVLPLLFYENAWLRFAGATAEVKLLNHAFSPTQRLVGGLRLKYSPEGYEASDSPRLAGMDERKGGIWGGAGLSWINPIAQVNADWTADLSGYSKGQRLQLQVEHRFALGAFSLSPRVGAQWMDSKYVDYYYGVRAHEVLADRAAYSPGSATSVEVGLRIDYALAPRHRVFLDVSATSLPSAIKDSPIVDRSTVSRAVVGYLYRF